MAHILLVDDQPDLRQIYQSMLEEQGHRVTVASGGRAALDILEQSKPDLVLLDIDMPEMNGIEAMRQIRGDQKYGGDALSIVFLTSHEMPEKVQEGLNAGGDAYIVKPLNPLDLLDELHLLLTSGEMGTF